MIYHSRGSALRRPHCVVRRPKKRTTPSKASEFDKIVNIGAFTTRMWYNVTWSLFLIFCLILCIYQTCNRLNLYYANPITTIVSILRNSTFLYPIITVCGSLKGGTNEMEKYLARNRWDCSGPKEKKFWETLTALNLNQIWSMANISKDFNVRGSLTSIDGADIKVKTHELSTIFGFCASLSLDVPVKPHPPSVYKLFLSRSVIAKCSDKPKVLIHTDADYAKSMFLETTSLELPHSVSGRLVLSAKQFKLVNTSNNPCYRDSERTKCFNDCVFNAIYNQTFCKFPFMDSVALFDHLPYCSGTARSSLAYSIIIERYRQTNPDNCKCPKICDEVVYSTSLFIDDKLENETLIVVEVSDTNIELIEQKLSYDFISLLCDIGGNLSLYIGVCLLSVLDFIESICKIISKTAFFNRCSKVGSAKETVILN